LTWRTEALLPDAALLRRGWIDRPAHHAFIGCDVHEMDLAFGHLAPDPSDREARLLPYAASRCGISLEVGGGQFSGTRDVAFDCIRWHVHAPEAHRQVK
jgi:hypothetical protein